MSDFCLSSKKQFGYKNGVSAYPEEDVKEFIRLLKLELYNDPEPCCHGVREKDFDKIVGFLAGEGLI